MTIEDHIKEQFEHQKIIENLARYELYYQISLSHIVSQSEFDVKSTYKKINALSLDIDPETVFYTIISIIRHFDDSISFQKNYIKELQKHATIHALEDYVKKDKELLKPETFLASIVEQVNEGTFFSEKMQKQFDSEYKISTNRWQNIIAEELSFEIKSKALGIL
ncbi:MAG: hypothetical protein HRT43_10775 [Campylobacteraceae bacterium]|nr:hypothetical protein [Campylobacteraceae bacterium]